MTNKLISRIVVAIASVFLLTSCAAMHDYSTVPYVGLDKGGFTYERSVKCAVSSTYVLSFGGMLSHSLMDELKEKAALHDGEVLVNVNVHRSTSLILFGLITTVKYSATADVVRLNP